MPARPRRWSASSRRLGALLLAVLVPSAATLVWLGVQLVEQDRRLFDARDRERRDTAADVVVRSLTDKLAAAERSLSSDAAPPEGAVLARLGSRGGFVRPPDGVLWLPEAPKGIEANAERFAEAEVAELRRIGDRGRGVYARLSRSDDPAVRAGALLRLARLQRNTGQVDAALATYRTLLDETAITIITTPADLVARRAIGNLLHARGDRAALERESESLRADLLAGRWAIDQVAWRLAADDLVRWTSTPIEVPERRAVSMALDSLWQQKRDEAIRGTARATTGQQSYRVESTSILLRWRLDGEALSVLVLPPSVVRQWVKEAVPADLTPIDALVVTDETGVSLAGTRVENERRLISRSAGETGLPWNLMVRPTTTADEAAAMASRRRLLSAGLGAIVLLLTGGGYLLWRSVQREMAVARMQTEFVAAVSHEFRTPLTSLQHVTELLEEDDELPDDNKRRLYATLGRSTNRLRKLVESLLDFARMEEGRRPYHLQPTDAAALVREVVNDFERHAQERATISTDLPPPGRAGVHVDAAALKHALWNLLDNAVKYSSTPHGIRVSVVHAGDEVAIAVADQGYGIPVREQQAVFEKFVRGSDAATRGIKGTGLGLAMVSHIVAAHHGRIALQSAEGRGSTFTIVFPATP